MNQNEKYCFLAFGELALDITYDENGIIKESGGVSAFNILYNLSVFGEETYAIGGTGGDMNAVKTIEGLKKTLVNTNYIKMIKKPTNVFYIYKPKEELHDDNQMVIQRVSPVTGKSSIKWSDKLSTSFPKEFEERNVVLIISNFEPVTSQFVQNTKNNCKNSKISLDITNGKIFEKYSNDYILEYLKGMDMIQCNEVTAEILCKKLNFSSIEELFSEVNAEIFTVTRGSKGATFFYRDGDEERIISKKPKIIAPLIDTTGAGDAFHSMLLMSYCRMKYNNEKLNQNYFDKAFNVANAFSRKIVQIEGARGEQYEILKYMLNEIKRDEKIFEEKE